MKTRKSQSILKEKCEKPLSSIDKERLAQSCGSLSQRGIKQGWAVDRELRDLVVNQTQTNNTPRPIKEELNQLAKAWCELMLNQIQETAVNRN